MEKFTINYRNKSKEHTREVFANNEDAAIDDLERNLGYARYKFEVIEIIPQGIVSGFEVRLVGSKIIHL